MSRLTTAEGEVRAPDGLALFFRRWLPDEPRGLVLLVHGLGEHSGRYGAVAEWLCGRGYGCYGLDYRGHGRSPGLRVHVDRFDEFVGDVAVMREHIDRQHPSLPRFLLGHSLGGLVALGSTLRDPDGLTGLVLSSPFLGIHPSSRPSAAIALVGRLMSRLAPRFRLASGLRSEHLCHDPEVVAAYDRDPLVSSKVSARWFTEVQAMHERVLAEAGRLRLPTLVMQSGDDRLVDPESTRRWTRAAPAHLVEYVEWDALYHEMLNEPECEKVFERLEGWLTARLEEG